jgi:hypothetical protein
MIAAKGEAPRGEEWRRSAFWGAKPKEAVIQAQIAPFTRGAVIAVDAII